MSGVGEVVDVVDVVEASEEMEAPGKRRASSSVERMRGRMSSIVGGNRSNFFSSICMTVTYFGVSPNGGRGT
jgi:hypothetical protein